MSDGSYEEVSETSLKPNDEETTDKDDDKDDEFYIIVSFPKKSDMSGIVLFLNYYFEWTEESHAVIAKQDEVLISNLANRLKVPNDSHKKPVVKKFSEVKDVNK